MDIIAEKMVFGGDCIGHIDGKTVFIPGLLPGEKAEIEITQQRKDFCRAEVVSLVEPSPHRVQPLCPHFGECGGCNLQIADTNYQRELRLSILKDSFLRSLGRSFCENPENNAVLECIANTAVVSDEPWGYRSRFQFHEGGLKKNNSAEIIPISHCPVASDAVNKVLQSGVLQHMKGRVHVFEETVAVEDNKCRQLDQLITVQVAGKKLQFDVRGFFQSNIPMLEKTINLVQNTIDTYSNKSGALLDMYCGVGTFSTFFAPFFSQTVLVEHNFHAVETARKNISANRSGSSDCRFFALSGEEFCRNQAKKQEFDTVIIDPPRSGMEKAVSSWLCEAKPGVIASISCDPVTHGRDAKILLEAGYVLQSLTLLDFYPQTSHIESYAVFIRPYI